MKLLVLTDKYYPRPYANAMCAQELIQVWNEQGHDVDVLAYEDFDGCPAQWCGNDVYYVKTDKRLKLFYYSDTYRDTKMGKLAYMIANVLSKLRGTLLLPWQPFYSLSFPRRIYRIMCKLQEEKNYDSVVAILKPIDSNIAACWFKKKYPSVPYIVFCVDTLKKINIQKYFGKKFADGFIWEEKILKRCDAYFYMHAREEDYHLKRYDSYRKKFRESDLPRFKNKNLSETPIYDFGEDAEHWVYAGSIGGPHYDPNQLIEIFKQIEDVPKRVLHLYTRGMEADRIAEIAKTENLNIYVHGYVDAVTLESIMATADVIVSLKTSDQISAKIFECMSYGKPVVHFSGHKKDPNVYYIEKYTLGYVVRTYDASCNIDIKGLSSFLNSNVGKKIDPSKLRKTFEMSTPEFSAEKIMDEILNVSINGIKSLDGE